MVILKTENAMRRGGESRYEDFIKEIRIYIYLMKRKALSGKVMLICQKISWVIVFHRHCDILKVDPLDQCQYPGRLLA